MEKAFSAPSCVKILILLAGLPPFIFIGGEVMAEAQVVSATVLLRPADGRTVSGTEAITSENIEQYMPTEEQLSRVTAFFTSKGFDVLPGAGPVITITGTPSLYQDVFGDKVESIAKEGVLRGVQTEKGELELSLNALPSAVSEAIQSVSFETPPDFGPTDYFSQ